MGLFASLINICEGHWKALNLTLCEQTLAAGGEFLFPALWLMFTDFLPYFSLMRCVEVFQKKATWSCSQPWVILEVSAHSLSAAQCIVSNQVTAPPLSGDTAGDLDAIGLVFTAAL